MRVRQFELRLLAIGLTVLWAAGGGIVLIGYRPGGPLDLLVGIAASTPLLVAVAPIVWPPLVTSNRGSAGVFWIGILAGLLLIPSLGSITAQVIAGGTEPLLPSVEVVYPWALALLVTAVFAGLGISRQFIAETGLGPRRLITSCLFALAATSVIGVLFVGASVADDAAVRNKPQAYSPFGPTSPSLTPSGCDLALSVPTTATETLQVSGTVDTRSIGTVDLSGTRRGDDFAWTAEVAGAGKAPGTYAETRIGSSAWTRGPGGLWSTVPPAAVDGDLLDSTVLATALILGNRATAEDRGFEYVDGARARRCRVVIDGTTFEAAFPQAMWLIGGADIETWRGQVDYWIFSDDEVGEVIATVNGNASEILPHGIQATVDVKLTATDRGSPVAIVAPTR